MYFPQYRLFSKGRDDIFPVAYLAPAETLSAVRDFIKVQKDRCDFLHALFLSQLPRQSFHAIVSTELVSRRRLIIAMIFELSMPLGVSALSSPSVL